MKNFKCDAKLIRLAQSCEPHAREYKYNKGIRFEADGSIVSISGPTASFTTTDEPPEKDLTILIDGNINKTDETAFFDFHNGLCKIVSKSGKERYVKFQYNEDLYYGWRHLFYPTGKDQDYSYKIDASLFSLISIFSDGINKRVPVKIEANGASAWRFKPDECHWPAGTMIIIMPMRK